MQKEVGSTQKKSVPVKQEIKRFMILDASPYTVENPIPIDPKLPNGSFYRIQLGAFSQAVAPDAFGGISPITGETLPDRNLTKYYAGKFSKYIDAVASLSEVRSAGFDKAFIVSWFNGTKMSKDKVRKLEK